MHTVIWSQLHPFQMTFRWVKLSCVTILLTECVLQGFEALIDSSKEYPLTKIDSIMIRPGHTVLTILIPSYEVSYEIVILQNVVSLGATKLTPHLNIESVAPEKRNCYFESEHPPNNQLQAHHGYSYVCLKDWVNMIGVTLIIFHRHLAYLSATSNTLCQWWVSRTSASRGTSHLLIPMSDCAHLLKPGASAMRWTRFKMMLARY